MTLLRQILLAALVGSALAACAQLQPPGAASQGGGTAIEDQSPRFIGIIGTKTQHAPPFLGVPETNFYCLRSFVDRRTRETQHQLYVTDSYSGAERHWNAAHDGAGHSLRFIEIGTNEITCDRGCSYAEEFAAVIPEGELRRGSQGLTVIFAAGSGAEKRIIVSAPQIAAQLAAVDAKLPPAAASAEPASPR